jgi:hypothetical protein
MIKGICLSIKIKEGYSRWIPDDTTTLHVDMLGVAGVRLCVNLSCGWRGLSIIFDLLQFDEV